MGRPPIKKSGPMTNAEHQRRKRRKAARLKKLENPKLVAKQTRRAERERELAAKIRALPDGTYGVILADPPWGFEPRSRETGMDRAADNHYPTSKTAAIEALGVASLAAKQCVLGLWATAPMLLDALEVMSAWGFTYKTHAVWAKPKGGTGYWFAFRHELLLIGTRGAPPCPAQGEQWSSVSIVIEAPTGRHSEKPSFAHEFFEAFYPTVPKIELYRRGPARPGWSAWGAEAEPPCERATA
jgi:N6-adenosine-specific RNA methylase IME4